MKEKLRNNLIIVLSIFIFFGCWEIFSYVIDSPLVFPHLKTVIKEFSRLVVEKQFWISLSSSVLRVLEAFILTLFLGTILGLASGFWNGVKSFLFFPLSIIRTTPVVAVIMIMLFWFDSKTLPVICAVLMGLPLMTDSVCKAVRQTDKKLLEMAYVFKLSSFTKLSCVYIPCIKPYFVGAAHTVFSQGWKVVAAGEILALPRNALGTMLQDSRIILDTPKVFALTVSLSLLCIVSEKIFFGLCKLVMIVSSKCRRHICDGAFAVMSSDSDTSVFLKPKDLQTASLPDTAVNIKNLSFSYKTETVERKIFSDFSIDFESHKKTAIVSPTGSGKTTLLKILSGIIPSSQWTGTVLCPEVSVIFQEDRLVLGITVLKNVALPLFSIMKKEDAYKRAFYYLDKVGLRERAYSFPDDLSGGERQKVQAARAFAFPSSVILMDEGTNSLDENSKKAHWALIENLLVEETRTLIFVTHDEREAKEHAECIVSI